MVETLKGFKGRYDIELDTIGVQSTIFSGVYCKKIRNLKGLDKIIRYL